MVQVISNTTTSRPDAVLGLVHADETGGLSGKPLFKMSTDVLRDMYQLTRVSLSCCFCLLMNCNGKESQIMQGRNDFPQCVLCGPPCDEIGPYYQGKSDAF